MAPDDQSAVTVIEALAVSLAARGATQPERY